MRNGNGLHRAHDILGSFPIGSGNYAECELKRMIVDKARKVIVLMDTSKLDKSLPYTFCRVDEVHTIITDNTLPRDISIAARNAGVRVIVAR